MRRYEWTYETVELVKLMSAAGEQPQAIARALDAAGLKVTRRAIYCKLATLEKLGGDIGAVVRESQVLSGEWALPHRDRIAYLAGICSLREAAAQLEKDLGFRIGPSAL